MGEQSASYKYNTEGDLVEVVDATQEQRKFSYDHRGLLTQSAVLSDSGKLVSSVALTYEWNGLVTLSLQPENQTIGTYIDPQGRPKSFSISPDSPPIVEIDLLASNGRMLKAGDQVCPCIVYYTKVTLYAYIHHLHYAYTDQA